MAEREAVDNLVAHWRWASVEGHGGADAYIRVRDAAQRDGFRRAAQELSGAAGQGDEALLKLAVSLRQRGMSGEVPADVQLPAWPSHRPAPQLDDARRHREQQIGFGIALTTCASQLGELAGEE